MFVYCRKACCWQEALIQSNGHTILWRIVLKLGEMTHLAYDAPKKVSASQVIAAARAVLSEARNLPNPHEDIYIQTRKSQIQDIPNEGQTNRI